MYQVNATLRRVIYVIIFESLAILSSTLILNALSHGDTSSSLPMAVAVSVIAVIWNFTFNTGFEAIERKFQLTRTFKVRALHSLGFESGLILFSVPLFMVWYQISIWQAMMMEATLLVFFLIFTFVFTLVFDQVFALPNQQKPHQTAKSKTV